MKKTFFLFAILLFAHFSLYSQSDSINKHYKDRIILKNGNTFHCKVISIKMDEVSYYVMENNQRTNKSLPLYQIQKFILTFRTVYKIRQDWLSNKMSGDFIIDVDSTNFSKTKKYNLSVEGYKKTEAQIRRDSIYSHKESKFSISVNLGLSYCNRITNGDFNSPNFETEYSGPTLLNITYPTKYETAKIGSNFSIKFENKCSIHFSISYGLFYQNIGYSVRTSNTFYYSYYDYGGSATDTSTSLSLHFNYRYFGLLLMPKYYFSENHNNSWYFGAGIKLGMFDRISAAYQLQDNVVYETWKYGQNSDIVSCWESATKPFGVINIGKTFNTNNKKISFDIGANIMFLLNPETRSKDTSLPLTQICTSSSTAPGCLSSYATMPWPNINTNGKAYLYSIELTAGIVFHL